MKKFFDSVVERLKSFWGRMSSREKRRLVILALLIVALSVTAAALLSRTSYEILYADLNASEAGRILTALEEMGVPTKTQGTGTILVPKERVSELWMRLSAEGYNSEELDYSIYQQASAWGATDMDKRTYLQYQLETHLRQSILKMEKIQDCLVMVTMPKESAFVLSSETQPAQAMVMLVVRSGATLTGNEANAVAEMVRSGVPGLKTENITITDSKMNLYRISGDEGTDIATGIGTQLALENQVRDRLEAQVVNLLAPVFGTGRIKATVNVALNFDKETVESVVFEPPIPDENSGIVVSMQELYESVHNGEYGGGVPGTDTNGMGTVQYPYNGLAEDELYNKVSRQVNYEINETRSQIEKAKGTVKTLSIAVLIDSAAVSEDYTANVRDLVANAIGVKDNYISVQRMPFQVTESEIDIRIAEQEAFIREMEMWDRMELVIKGIVILLLAVCVLFMVRTVAQALVHTGGGRQKVVLADGTGMDVDYLVDEDGEFGGGRGALPGVELNTKSETVQQLEKFIEKDAGAVAQLLRNWLADD